MLIFTLRKLASTAFHLCFSFIRDMPCEEIIIHYNCNSPGLTMGQRYVSVHVLHIIILHHSSVLKIQANNLRTDSCAFFLMPLS